MSAPAAAALPAPPQPLSFAARDGRALAGLLLAAASPRGALLVNGATGFKREFYLKFAAYCAGRGYHTLLHDYRGIGASAGTPLERDTARMSDWGRLDMPAALAALGARCPGLPLVTLGHSVGGQLIGCMPNQARARAHVMIATSTGYWRRQRVPFRYQALIFWKVYGPLMLRRARLRAARNRVDAANHCRARCSCSGGSWCLSAAPFGSRLDARHAR